MRSPEEQFDRDSRISGRALIAIVLIGASALAGFLLSMCVHAEVQFTASPTSGISPFATDLTWNAPGATTCIAGDTYGWRGNVPPVGQRRLSGMRASKVTLTLTCDAVNAPLTWTQDTKNTDGSELKNLTGFRIQYGVSPDMLSEVVDVSATVRTYTLKAAPGVYYVAIRALTDTQQSDLSNVIKRTIGASETATIDLKIDTKPAAPVLSE